MRVTRPTKLKVKVRRLSYPGVFHLRAAEGWLELGNPREAWLELEEITPSQRIHPDVLLLRWRVFAELGRWTRCLAIARALVEAAPEDWRSWVALARTFCRKGKVKKAYSVCLAKLSDFPSSWELLYEMACFACLLGKLQEANHYLGLAIDAADNDMVKRRAKADPDLIGLWKVTL